MGRAAPGWGALTPRSLRHHPVPHPPAAWPSSGLKPVLCWELGKKQAQSAQSTTQWGHEHGGSSCWSSLGLAVV